MKLNNTISFTVYGNPIALKRHRSGKYGMYDPSKPDKDNFLLKCIQHKPPEPFLNPVILEVKFYMKRPKNHYGTGKNAHLIKKQTPHKHTFTPDLDNLVKFIKDAMNNVFYKDDSQVYCIKAIKIYTDTDKPRTEVKLIETAP